MAERTELNVLNNLLDVCRDGEHGFGFAAAHATNPDVRALFTTLSDERHRFAEELSPHVRRLGGQAATDGTTAAAVHRRWMQLKQNMSSRPDDVLLVEAKRGEEAAMQAYRAALTGQLPPTAIELIKEQYHRVCEAHRRMLALEEMLVAES